MRPTRSNAQGNRIRVRLAPLPLGLVCLALIVPGCGPDTGSGDPDPIGGWFMGLTKGSGGFNGQSDYCDDGPDTCVAGETDCDSDVQCAGALVCGRNVGERFGFGPYHDVCCTTWYASTTRRWCSKPPSVASMG